MKKFVVIIEDSKKSIPRQHELEAAQILANYFSSDIIFLRRLESKTPDLYIIKTNQCWEIKSPCGNGKRTIQNNLRNAAKQSENIILDLRQLRLSESQSLARIHEFTKHNHSNIKHLKIITKQSQVVDIIK